MKVVDGEEVQVGRLSVGQYFGELALISKGHRVATVRALTYLKVQATGWLLATLDVSGCLCALLVLRGCLAGWLAVCIR